MILDKLKEFNGKVEAQAVNESSLGQLQGLMTPEGTTTAQELDLLWQLLQWPHGQFETK